MARSALGTHWLLECHMRAVMQGAVDNSIFGWDPTSIYLLLTDPLVSVQYHCAKFCSYTDTFNTSGRTAFFGVVPHAARCPFACGYYLSE